MFSDFTVKDDSFEVNFIKCKKRVLYSCHIYQMSNLELKSYTISQLSLRNGQDKPEIWCAYKGFIYDLGKSKLWQKGKHYEHFAGQDLTAEMKDAPHTEFVFDKFEPIGILIN